MNSNDKKQEQQEYLKAFNNYFPRWDRESGCIKKIKEDLKKIKQMTNPEEKLKEVSFAWSWHNNKQIYVSGLYNAGNLHELVKHSDTIDKYRKLVKELWDLNIELIRQKEQSSTNDNKRERERERERESQSKTKSTQQTKSNQSLNNNQPSQQQTNQPEQPSQLCPTCSTPLNPNTDYFNFCSEQCHNKHYGTLCPLCNKYHTTTIYWDQENYPSLTYCLDCYEKELKRKEQKESELRKLEANRKYCLNCLTDLNEFNQQSNLDYCRECWEKMTRRIREGDLSENNLVVNNQVDSLKSQIIQLESQTNPNQTLLNSKKEELRSLEKRLNQENVQVNDSSKMWLGICLGILGVGLVGVLVWLIFRRKK